jgi:hypothetical protein
MATAGSPREQVVQAFIGWGDPVNDPAGNLGELHFDVILSESHELTTLVTEHSVEQGSAIVDHVRPNPDKVTLEVFVSNTPIYSSDGTVGALTLDVPQPGPTDKDGNPDNRFLAGGTTALLDKGLQLIGLQKGLPTQVTANVLRFQGPTDYVRNCYAKLRLLRDSATLLRLTTPRADYDNMIIETVTMHRDKSTGTSANFTLNFRQINIVTSRVVAAPIPSVPAAAPVQPNGKKDTANANVPLQSGFAKNAVEGGHAPPPAFGFNATVPK